MNTKKILELVLKVVALGMAIASLVLGFIPEAGSFDTSITLLGIGLAALALTSLQNEG